MKVKNNEKTVKLKLKENNDTSNINSKKEDKNKNKKTIPLTSKENNETKNAGKENQEINETKGEVKQEKEVKKKKEIKIRVRKQIENGNKADDHLELEKSRKKRHKKRR